MSYTTRIKLLGGTLETTQLGFGGNDLLGNKTQDQALRLLETAFEEGIRHFDVAPSYGYGDAERILGLFAKGKRSEITLATKFGRQTMLGGSRGARHLVGCARRMMRASSVVRKLVKRNAHHAIATGRFDVASAQRSLDSSLKLLGTDYIDVYLLHECTLEDCTPALLGFLENARATGKIRCFGTGTSAAATTVICRDAPAFSSLIQIKANSGGPGHQLTLSDPRLSFPERALFLHGALAQVGAIKRRYGVDSGYTKEWDAKVQIDPYGPELVGLILQSVFAYHPQGVVLFRSASPKRIVTNIRAAFAQAVSATQISHFWSMIHQLEPSVH